MINEIWKPDFCNSSPIFEPIMDFSASFSNLNSWPSLIEFNRKFSEHGLNITSVAQQGKPEKFDDLYESRIYLKGELQTRTENWHDFFNAMVWLGFRHIKHTLNEFHYTISQTRDSGTNRSPLENAIALFDECGLIIICDNEALLELIRRHQWKKLFIDHRDEFNQHIRCITFGHAMYEKALNPYIGMTAHAILIHSDGLLNKDLSKIDEFVASMWKNKEITTTRDLQPVPILGIPGWYKNNQTEEFYDNQDYFRPERT